jgi:prepilin-type N-terminal cleavage/methylation domain-containing protein
VNRRTDRGFSLVELLVATGIFLAVAAILFHFIGTSARVARAQPDMADVSQRLRVAASTIARDIGRAGAGDAHAALGALAAYFPPIVPARTGALGADPEFSAFDDRISLVYVPEDALAVTLSLDMVNPSADVPILAVGPGCPGAGLCGFEEGSRAAIVDASALGAGFELFTVSHTAGSLGHAAPDPSFTKPYPSPSAQVVPVVQRVYSHDKTQRRIMVYDGYKSTQPLVDNVVALSFAYLIDPHAASVRAPSDLSGNCAFGAGNPPVPLLAAMGPGALVPAPLEMFTDGPFCGIPPRRFDADLLRIRAVRLTIRVQAALDRARGSGPGFANRGHSDSDLSAVRDFEITVDAAARNLRPFR